MKSELTLNDRKNLIEYRLSRAVETLEEAQYNADGEYFNTAVNGSITQHTMPHQRFSEDLRLKTQDLRLKIYIQSIMDWHIRAWTLTNVTNQHL